MPSIDARLREVERRLAAVPGCRLDFVRPTDGTVALTVGAGPAHVVLLKDTQVAFVGWLAEHWREDLTASPTLLIGDNRAGQDEALIIAAVVLALARGVTARIYAGGGAMTQQFVADELRAMLPPSWQALSNPAARHYRVSAEGAVEVASVRARHRGSPCGAALILDYAAGSQRQNEHALETGTIKIVAGEPPTSATERWILEYRDAARSGGRLFRFRRAPNPAVDALIEIIDSDARRHAREFWGTDRNEADD